MDLINYRWQWTPFIRTYRC